MRTRHRKSNNTRSSNVPCLKNLRLKTSSIQSLQVASPPPMPSTPDESFLAPGSPHPSKKWHLQDTIWGTALDCSSLPSSSSLSSSLRLISSRFLSLAWRIRIQDDQSSIRTVSWKEGRERAADRKRWR